MIIREKFNINSNGFGEVFDITQRLYSVIANSETSPLIINAYSISASCAFLRCKEEVIKNLYTLIDSLIKENKTENLNIKHYELVSLFKANFFKNSLSIPVENNKMLIDNSERVYFLNFENQKNISEIVVSLIS